MITVHHLGASQSHRVVWLCEELGLPYRLERYERDPKTRLAPPAYRTLHPLGTAPVISDGDLVLPESGAILTYLIEKYGGGRLAVAPDSADYANYLFWFHFANGSLMPSLTVRMVLRRSGGSDDHPVVRALTERATSAFAFVEQRLGAAPYLTGEDFTAADIMMFFPLSEMPTIASIDLSGYTRLRDYLKRLRTRPAYQRATAQGDPEMLT
jgi:glutathione S-transferase